MTEGLSTGHVVNDFCKTFHSFKCFKLGSILSIVKNSRIGASLVTQMVKNLHVMQETRVQSLGWENPLEKGMATQLQYSCLENSMDRRAWWTTGQGKAKSWTQ